jgi:hypothetical protein
VAHFLICPIGKSEKQVKLPALKGGVSRKVNRSKIRKNQEDNDMEKQHKIYQIFILLIVFSLTSTIALAGVLDGKTFTGSTGKAGKAASEKEEIRFMNGNFYSVGCAEWGFGEAAYTAQVSGDTVSFEAVTTSPKHGKIVWSGIVKGDKMDATYIWTKKGLFGTRKQEKWFKGTLK